MMTAPYIASVLAGRRLSRLEKPTAHKVRLIWKEARADAAALIEKTPAGEGEGLRAA